MPKPSLEICCYSIEDAVTAHNAGATRIEFCSGQRDGGTTASYGALIQLSELQLPLEIVLMIRSRGGDFCYGQRELQQMCNDIRAAKELGFTSFALGALTPQREVDLHALELLLDAAGNSNVTFHRAFDWAEDPRQAAQQLQEQRVQRVLSSGQQVSVEAGLPLLVELQTSYPTIEWVAAGGVRQHNVEQVLQAGLWSLHSAASKPTALDYDASDLPAMAASADSLELLARQQVCFEQVAGLRKIIQSHHQ